MKRLLTALLTTTALCGSAQAADIARAPAGVSVPAIFGSPWTGFYVGVDTGYGWGSDTVSATGAEATFASRWGIPSSYSPEPSGWLVGGHAGYTYSFGFLAAGIETDIAWARLRGSTTWDDHIVGIPAASSITVTDELDWLGTTRLRLGVSPVGSLLIYGTGGVAYGGVTTTGHLRFPPNEINATHSSTEIGWAAGAGVEYALGAGWSVRAEWLHYDLGEVAWRPAAFADDVKTQAAGNLVRGGVSYRF